MGTPITTMAWAGLTLFEVALPLKKPFATATGSVAHRRLLMAHHEFKNGITVWSECAAFEHPTYTAETIGTAWLALTQWLGPTVIGKPWDHPAQVDGWLSWVRGHQMAKATLEMAAWAAHAVQMGQPLAQLLGGTRDRIPIGTAIGIQPDLRALVETVQSAMDAGYARVKVKIKPGDDRIPLQTLRATFGPSLPLMADANCAYTLADAGVFCDLDKLNLMMIEQPLGWNDQYQHRLLQDQLQTPLCLDESITSVTDVALMHALGSGRVVNLKPGRVGGFTQSLRIHDYCLAHRIPMWCGGMLDSGIGRAYSQALAALPGFTLPGDVSPADTYLQADLVTEPAKMDKDGRIVVNSTDAGLGISVSETDIRALAHRHERVI
jgi:O-succinylbenzoate synthase